MKKTLLAFALLFITACSHTTTTAPTASEPITLTGSEISYTDGINGYLATPEGEGPFPAMIMIHEWWGLNDNIRQLADEYAEAGYVALAVDLYDGQFTDQPNEARELAGAVREDRDGAFENLEAGIDFLKTHPLVDAEKVASVGWCFGGGWSYEIAKNNLGTKASVIYYGRFNPEDDLSIMRTNILGHFGEDDASIKVDDVNAFQATLNTLEGDHEIYIYPNSGHAFANEDSPAYVEGAAKTAWERTLNFLETNLQ